MIKRSLAQNNIASKTTP